MVANKRRSPWAFILFALLAMLAVTLVLSHPVHSYIKLVKTHVKTMGTQGDDLTGKRDDPLWKEIVSLSRAINEKPENARIDAVWKAIPGYNGLEVDLVKSYRIAQQIGRVDLRQLVIDEVEPHITLDDLPPAAIYRGHPKKPALAFMVNVAWGTEYIEPILDILDRYQIKATFFLDGKWLERNKTTAEMMVKRGHELGNHAYSHPDMRKLSIEQIYEEMTKTEELIKQLGVHSHYFAPPAGAYDERVVQVARQLQMHTVMWTLDTLDWKKPTPQEIIVRIVPRLENGVLILMHPTESTVVALPELIEGALKKGIEPATVSEVLSSNRTIFIEPAP